MKKYILTLCLTFFSVCFTVAHAQREIEAPDNGDEYIDDGYPGDDLDEDPIKVGDLPKAKTKCNRSRCEGHENISFSFNNTPHALRMEALVNSIERKGLSDWLFIQESIIKKELDGRNRHVSSTYEFARNEYFANFEKDIANRNIPILSSGRNRVINDAKHKRTPFYKNIKLLRARFQEIKQGNINRSLYATKTYNNRPMSYYKTESSINSILNSELNKFYANEVKINEDLLIRDQLGEMLKSIRAVNSLGVTDNILKVLKNKQIGYYNDFNRWHQISLMQRYLSGVKKGNNSGNIWPKEFGTNDYLLAYAKAHRKKDINIFHKDYWKVILKRDYRNNPLKSIDAINKYIRLREAELARLLNSTPINVNSAVDFLVSELSIINASGLKWLNNNPEKAIEMQSLLNLTRIDPNPNVFNSTKRNLTVRILENGTVEEMITKLKLDSYRSILYNYEEEAYKLRVFAYQNSPGGIIKGEALAFIKEALEAIKNRGEVNIEDRIFNFLEGKALCVYNKLKNLNLFKSTINQFEQGNDYNLHLIEDYTKCRVTDEACTNASDFKNGNITIYFRGTGNNNLEFASTILHEGIHAEIFRYVDRYKKGLDPIKKKELLDYYFDYKSQNDPTIATSEAQHQYMADRFVKPIARAIRKLDNNKYPLKFYMGYGWDGLRSYGYDNYRNDNGQYITLDKSTSSEYYRNQKIVNDNSEFNNKECQ